MELVLNIVNFRWIELVSMLTTKTYFCDVMLCLTSPRWIRLCKRVLSFCYNNES